MGDRMHRRTLGPLFSEGARLVWLEMLSRGWSIAELARSADVPHTGLHRCLYGDRMAGVASLVKLEKVTGVPVAAWAEPPTETFVPPGAAPAALGARDGEPASDGGAH